jgi:carbon storage regulator
MLWLRRREGEAIVLPGLDVEIVVGGISGDTVRIGIEAPDSVSIHRREIWRAMLREDGEKVLSETTNRERQ